MILDKYKNHPNVLAIIQNQEYKISNLTFQEIENVEVVKLLKSLDGRKSTGEDRIPPKHVSLAANELTNTLTTVINCTIRNSCFPHDAKKQQYARWTRGARPNSSKKFSPS